MSKQTSDTKSGFSKAASAVAGGYLWESAPVLACVLDAHGRVLRANRKMECVTGDVTAGRQFADLLWDAPCEFVLDDALGDPGRELMLDLCTARGAPLTYFFQFFPLEGETLVFGREDSGELDRLRAEIMSLNSELANHARELQQDKAQLERLNQLKNTFLGMAAHDLRRPIGAVMSFLWLLREELAGAVSDETRGFFDQVMHLSEHMKRIVDDFLDLAVIESGRLQVVTASAMLSEIVGNACSMLAPIAGLRRVTLKVQCDPDIPKMLIDASKLEQVAVNIVSNAIEHTPEGSAVVVRGILGPDTVTVSVSDCGPGLTAEDMARVFEPFKQGQSRKAAGQRGTGLGLAISRMIVEAHRGRLWAESTPGRGATFLFSLPLPAPAPPDSAA